MSKRRRIKFWYTQDWGTYDDKTLVFVGYTEREALAQMKRAKLNKRDIAIFEMDLMKDEIDFDDFVAGSAWYRQQSQHSAIFLPSFTNTMESYETLMHECLHLTLYVMSRRNFIDSEDGKILIEQEGIAYQFEYLFHNIRRRLQKAYGYR